MLLSSVLVGTSFSFRVLWEVRTEITESALRGFGVDVASNVYMAGFTQRQDFSTTPGAYQSTNHSPTEGGFALKLDLPPCTLSGTVPSVTICSPTATAKSPIVVSAGATDDHDVTAMTLYVDGTKKFTISNNSHFDTKVALSKGTHKLTVKAWDTAGRVISKIQNVTVQ